MPVGCEPTGHAPSAKQLLVSPWCNVDEGLRLQTAPEHLYAGLPVETAQAEMHSTIVLRAHPVDGLELADLLDGFSIDIDITQGDPTSQRLAIAVGLRGLELETYPGRVRIRRSCVRFVAVDRRPLEHVGDHEIQAAVAVEIDRAHPPRVTCLGQTHMGRDVDELRQGGVAAIDGEATQLRAVELA